MAKSELNCFTTPKFIVTWNMHVIVETSEDLANLLKSVGAQ